MRWSTPWRPRSPPNGVDHCGRAAGDGTCVVLTRGVGAPPSAFDQTHNLGGTGRVLRTTSELGRSTQRTTDPATTHTVSYDTREVVRLLAPPDTDRSTFLLSSRTGPP